MANLRVGTPKFYIDAVLLAKQWGMINWEYQWMASGVGDDPNDFFNLNPTKIKIMDRTVESDGAYIRKGVEFKVRQFTNAISHCFLLGHRFLTTNTLTGIRVGDLNFETGEYVTVSPQDYVVPYYNGWNLINLGDATMGLDDGRINLVFKQEYVINDVPTTSNEFYAELGEISLGWSYQMQHSPDLELTQSFSNESISTQTTKGGHTLTNVSHNHAPKWLGQQWVQSTLEIPTIVIGSAGRRSWSLKFSYLSDDDTDKPLFPTTYNTVSGIFEGLADNPDTAAIDFQEYNVKKDFLSRVWFGTNCGQLPFIFQPNSDVQEYAICRITNTPSFTQISNTFYDVSLEITEVW